MSQLATSHVTYNYKMRTSNDDVDIGHHRSMALRVLGAFQLIAGLLSIGLGVGAICTFASGYYIGYGIWAGVIFCISGILSAVTGLHGHQKTGIMTATMTFCVISIWCAAAQFSIGVVAVVNDRYRSDTGELSRDLTYLQYDIYYERNNPFRFLYPHHCAQSYGAFTWDSAWGPVDILLLIVGILELMIAVVTASICCYGLCRGERVTGGKVMPGVYVSDRSVIMSEPRYPESAVSGSVMYRTVK